MKSQASLTLLLAFVVVCHSAIVKIPNRNIKLLPSFKPIEDIDALQNVNYEEISLRSNEVLGTTAVVLDGTSCRTRECNFGNLITDAIIHYYATNFVSAEPWTDASIAIIHSGAIARSIAPTSRPAPITRGDLFASLPSESNLVAVNISGTILSQVLEHSVSFYSSNNPTGQLLQFSGIRASFNMTRAPGSRLVEAVVRCSLCNVPRYFVLEDSRTYKVLVPAALADGEFGYSMLVGLPRENLSFNEATATAEYISLRSPIYPENAQRVRIHLIQIPRDSAV